MWKAALLFCPYSSAWSSFLKPDGDRGESLALRRDPATQVTKAKRDIELKQGNHLLHTVFSEAAVPSLPRASRLERNKLCSLVLPISLQGLSLSLHSVWLPCSSHSSSQDAMSATLQSRILI